LPRGYEPYRDSGELGGARTRAEASFEHAAAEKAKGRYPTLSAKKEFAYQALFSVFGQKQQR